MAKLEVYSVFDAVASAYFPPFFVANEPLAVRAFLGALQGNPEMRLAPTDFTLQRLGDFDAATGVIVPLPAPVRVNVPYPSKESHATA